LVGERKGPSFIPLLSLHASMSESLLLVMPRETGCRLLLVMPRETGCGLHTISHNLVSHQRSHNWCN